MVTAITITTTLALGFALPLGASGPAPSPLPSRPAPTGPPPDKQALPWQPSASAPDPDGVTAAGIAGGYVFVPISPYRTYDSRDYEPEVGYMLGGDTVYFEVLTSSNGTPMIPANAVAVSYNLTVTNTYGSGFLGLFPANVTSWPGTSSINWTAAGQTIANGGVVSLGTRSAPGQLSVYCGPAANLGTDFLIDITGYYI
ncbi:MAG: hypothetical protein AB7L17_19245 [Ilumatobacteraceae bacterium]